MTDLAHELFNAGVDAAVELLELADDDDGAALVKNLRRRKRLPVTLYRVVELAARLMGVKDATLFSGYYHPAFRSKQEFVWFVILCHVQGAQISQLARMFGLRHEIIQRGVMGAQERLKVSKEWRRLYNRIKADLGV